MATDADTLVEPRLRKEALPARRDARRPMLLAAIVVAAATTGGLASAMFMARGADTSAHPRRRPVLPAPELEAVRVRRVPAIPVTPAQPPCASYGQHDVAAPATPPDAPCAR
ncbi:MAG: hypothetical protein R3B06_15260 [Kofleriaceae bacterium]